MGVPVFHYVIHTYGSWLPDRPRGYYQRGRGLKTPDPETASRYRRLMRHEPAFLTEKLQRACIEEAMASCRFRRLELYAAATEGVHIHILAGWRDERRAKPHRRAFKSSMTRGCNRVGRRAKWWSEGGLYERVRTARHLRHLREVYLPNHPGWGWDCTAGWRPPTCR